MKHESFRSECIDEYKESIYQIEMEAYQTSKGKFLFTNEACFMPSFTIGHNSLSGSVIHTGKMADDQFLFVLPDQNYELAVDGKIHSAKTVYCLGPNEETFNHFPVSVELIYFSFSTSSINRYFNFEEVSLIIKNMTAIREGKVELNNLIFFRKIINGMFFDLYRKRTDPNPLNIIEIEDSFFELLRSLLIPVIGNRKKIMTNTRKNIVSRAIEYITTYSPINISVPLLAINCFCSVRTLEYSFNNILGISPKQYLKLAKMYYIRTRLIASDPESLTTVLLSYNVSNLGRFSMEYRELFGESPVKTLRRTTISGCVAKFEI